MASVWIPRAARLTPANEADNLVAEPLIADLPLETRYVLGDRHYNASNVARALIEQCYEQAESLNDFYDRVA